jgi:ligand-binding sensor domain-containing protein/DNA-binding CsgD family transcriptional regulator/PAS domain-containing protein
LVITSVLSAQTPGFIVRHLTVNDGLSQNLISCILLDQTGFLWFGTPDGLNRYDGYEFKRYYFDPENPDGLSDNSIQALFEDPDGTIWIGTDQKGLDQYLPDLDRFKHHGIPSQANRSIPFTITSLAPYDQTRLWVGTNQGLWFFDRKSFQWSHSGTSLSPNKEPLRITSLLRDQNNDLWIGTFHGVFWLDPVKNKLHHYVYDQNDPHSLYSNKIFHFFEDTAGRIWIGTRKGLNMFNPISREMVRIPIKTEAKPPEITAIIGTPDHRLWLATTRKGLFRYDPETNTQFHLPLDESNSQGLSPSGFYDLLVDRDNLLWIGTQGMGVNVLNSQQPFHYYPSIPGDQNSLSDPSIRSILLDRDSILWVGGYNGLDAFNRKTGTTIHYRYTPGDTTSLPIPFVYALAEDEHGNIWIGTEGDGLVRLDRQTGNITHYPVRKNDPYGLPGKFVFSLFFDSKEDLWIGTNKGLSQLLKKNRSLGKFNHYTPENSGLPGPIVSCIIEDPFGNLWVGTESSGIGILNKKDHRFRAIRHDPTVPNSLSDNRILCILPEKTGSIWIGLKGGGLDQLKYDDYDALNPGRSKFDHYNKQDGLPNDVVYGILKDDQGNLWLSTNWGIIRFNPESQTFKEFPLIYGQQSREFNRGAWHRGWNGELFFGGIRGLNSFFPAEIDKNIAPPVIVLTNIKILNQSLKPGIASPEGILINQTANYLSGITLNYKALSTTLEFSALSFLDPLHNRYRYRLKGILDEWLSIPATQRTITLTHLPSGRYTLEIQAANTTGIWNQNSKRLVMHVQSAPWKTWWAILIYILILSLSIFTFIRLRLRQARQRTAELERQVAERTAEIQSNEKKLQEQNAFLETVIESLTYPFYVVEVKTYKLVMANSAARAWGKTDANTCYALKADQNKPCEGQDCPLRNLKRFKDHHIKRESIVDFEGKERHIEIHSHPIFNEAGEIDQIIEYYIDISDRVRLELSLKDNLEARNRELTTQAMKMARDHESTMAVLKELDQLRKSSSGIDSTLIRNIETSLKSQLSPGTEWDEFETWFKEVHKNFYDRLIQRVPDLTTRELKICAFLKLKLNTKEIASLTNLSAKSIEVYRSRIRKRLGVPTGENLINFINQI